jgi:hypothetical protein
MVTLLAGEGMGGELQVQGREATAEQCRAWLQASLGSESDAASALEASGVRPGQPEYQFAQMQRRACCAVVPALAGALAEAAELQDFTKPVADLWNDECVEAFIKGLAGETGGRDDSMDVATRNQLRELVTGMSRQFTFGVELRVGDVMAEIARAAAIAKRLGLTLPQMFASSSGVETYLFHRYTREEYVGQCDRNLELQTRTALNAITMQLDMVSDLIPLPLSDPRYAATRRILLSRKRLALNVIAARARKTRRRGRALIRKKADRVWGKRRAESRIAVDVASPVIASSQTIRSRLLEAAVRDLRVEDGIRDLDEAALALQLAGVSPATRNRLSRHTHELSLGLASEISYPHESSSALAFGVFQSAAVVVEELDRVPRERSTRMHTIRGEVSAVARAAKTLLSGRLPPKSAREEVTSVVSSWLLMVLQPLGVGLGWVHYKPVTSAGRIAWFVSYGVVMWLVGEWGRRSLRRHSREARLRSAAVLARGFPVTGRFAARISCGVSTGIGLGMLGVAAGGILGRVITLRGYAVAAVTLCLAAAQFMMRVRR